MKKYIVIKDKLNIRNRPLVEDEFYIGFARQGEELWLDDNNLVEGDAPSGTQDNFWMPDINGNFVSRAGVRPQNYEEKKMDFLREPFSAQFVDEADKADESKWKISWGHVDTEVWKLWQKGWKGQNIRIAVLDSGVDNNHTDLLHIKGIRLKVEGNQVTLTDKFLDLDGHGTNCCGLVAANGNGFYSGLAPAGNVVAFKLYNESFPSNKKEIFLLLLKAFDTIIEANQNHEGFDFVSMSFSLTESDLDGTDDATGKKWLAILQEKIDVISKRSFIICSAGEFENAYPAAFRNVLAVEAANKMKETKASAIDKTKLIYAPAGDHLKTTTLSSFNPPYLADFTDSSAATAFTAGYFALCYSSIKDGSENKRKVFSDAIAAMIRKNDNYLGVLNFTS
ncbi:MAG: S8 family serine peptidase [Chitinophagaceae bacterium]|nr:S8 family serine peptidase [Chitinophagaceae bacterium]